MTLLSVSPAKRRTQSQPKALLSGERFYMTSASVTLNLHHPSLSVPRLARVFARRKKFINRVLAFEFPGHIKLPLAA